MLSLIISSSEVVGKKCQLLAGLNRYNLSMKKTIFRRVIASQTTTIQIITIEMTMLENTQDAVVIDAAVPPVPPVPLPENIHLDSGAAPSARHAEPLPARLEDDEPDPEKLE